MTKTALLTTRVLLATAAGAVACLAAAGSAHAAPLKATSSCYLDVINDWVDNNRVDKVYAPACYRKAIKYLESMPDVQGYSSAPDDIRRALLFALKHPGSTGGGGSSSSGGGGGGSSGGGGGSSASGGGSSSSSGGGQTTTSKPSFFDEFGSKINPSDAQSIPLPLLVLGGLAILLLLTALGAWIARRVQSRRIAPAKQA